jgi:hypothetical protein
MGSLDEPVATASQKVVMSRIGKHHHLDVAREFRSQTRALYQNVLGAKSSPTGGAALPASPDLEVFEFDNGSSIGVFYVSADATLTPEQHMRAIWLEFEVADVAKTTTALADLGIEPFEYEDRSHPYFQAPGGQVFRLAQQA